MAVNSQVNSAIVKTELDAVVYQEYNQPPNPNHTDSNDEDVFHQSSTDRAAVIYEVFKGVGYFGVKTEEGDVPNANPQVADKGTSNVVTFGNEVRFSYTLYEDAMFDFIGRTMKDFGRSARQSRDKDNFAIYRNAFTTTLTVDGVPLISATHNNIAGSTVSNIVAGALSDATINTAIISLAQQKGQDDTVNGYMPQTLLVPLSQYKTAVIETDSVLRPGTANNDLNVYSLKYGITPKTTPFMGSVVGGSDTAWFLLSDNHNIYRWVRQGLQTVMVPWQYQSNDSYVYKGNYREVSSAITYEGIVGSTGL